MARRLFFGFFAWAAVAAACATGGGEGFDGGRRPDVGSRDDCGAPGAICCPRAPRCDNTVCGVDGTCCAVVGIGRCEEDSECCGDLECVGGGCCVSPGQPCGSAIDCCNNGLCLAGFCLDETGVCGAERGVCCEDGACRAGLECDRGTCLPCGGDGEPCCRTGDACEAEGVCIEGICGAAVQCGGEGEPCCELGACTGALVCGGGTCNQPVDLCDFADCESCASAVSRGCGFCEDTGDCAAGSAAGPSEGACETWRFGATTCPAPDPCPGHGSCDDCTAEASCGFCATDSRCVSGTSAGPADGSGCTDWRWTAASCLPDSCGSNTGCRACTLDFSLVCGWCGPAARCRRGTRNGPVDGSCAEADWSWLSSECP